MEGPNIEEKYAKVQEQTTDAPDLEQLDQDFALAEARRQEVERQNAAEEAAPEALESKSPEELKQMVLELRRQQEADRQEKEQLRFQLKQQKLIGQGMLDAIAEGKATIATYEKAMDQGVPEFIADLQRSMKELEALNAALEKAVSVGIPEVIRDYQQQIASLTEKLKGQTEKASHDPLTGLLNRLGFVEKVRPVFETFVQLQGQKGAERREGAPIDFSIITLDIDKFKNINDTYGHPAGDAVLRKLGEILKSNLRAKDTVARYGGEEFVVALVGLEPGARYRVAEKLRQAIEEATFEFEFDGKTTQIPVTASFGTARYLDEQPDPGTPDEDRAMNVINKVLVRADSAMYQAKNTGRNKVVVAEVFEEEVAKIRAQVLALFDGGEDITPDDAERALDISQESATRFLDGLEKEGIVIKVGENERGMAYRKIQPSTESAA